MAVMVLALRDNVPELWLVISQGNSAGILLLLLMPAEKHHSWGPYPTATELIDMN